MDTTLLDELERQHRMVEDMLTQLESAEEDEQLILLGDLRVALDEHMELEEQQVYPALRELEEDQAVEAETEHGLARDGLAKLEELVGQPGFGAAVAMLKAGIEHHVQEEETEAFPRLREESGGNGQREPSEPSRSELYDRARELEIPGRSSMTKDELARAVASAE